MLRDHITFTRATSPDDHARCAALALAVARTPRYNFRGDALPDDQERAWYHAAFGPGNALLATLRANEVGVHTYRCLADEFASTPPGRIAELGVYYDATVQREWPLLAGLLASLHHRDRVEHAYACANGEVRHALETLGFRAIGHPFTTPLWPGEWQPMLLPLRDAIRDSDTAFWKAARAALVIRRRSGRNEHGSG